MDLNIDESSVNNVFEQFNYDFSSKINNIYITNSLSNKKENIQQILDFIKQIDENKPDIQNRSKKASLNLNSPFKNKPSLSKSEIKVFLPKIMNEYSQEITQKSRNINNLNKELRSFREEINIKGFKSHSFNKIPKTHILNVKSPTVSPIHYSKNSTSSFSLPNHSLKKENSINNKKILQDIYLNCKKEEELSRSFPRQLLKSKTKIELKNDHLLKRNKRKDNVLLDLNCNKIPTRIEINEMKKTEKRDRIKHISPNLAYRARDYFVNNLDVRIDDRSLDFQLKYNDKQPIKKIPLFNNVNNLLNICDKKKTELIYKLKNKLLYTKKV